MEPRLIIREASLHELEDIRRFYQDNHDPHVMFRADPDVKSAIDDGVFFLAIDVCKPDDKRIVGASAVYSVVVKDAAGNEIILKESGGSLVSPEYRGYGLHKIFHSARALHKFVFDRGGFDHYFGAILCPNPASEKNILKAGFTPWDNPPAGLVAAREPYEVDGMKVRYFELKPAALSDHAKNLLESAEIGSVTHAKTALIAKLDLPIQLLRHYRLLVEKLANGDPHVILEIDC